MLGEDGTPGQAAAFYRLRGSSLQGGARALAPARPVPTGGFSQGEERPRARAPDGLMTASELDRERELVKAARSSKEAFEQLYDRYVVRIYCYAYARTGSHHDAEDLTSETFRRALEHIGSYRWEGVAFGAWLHRIAANLVIERHRREHAREPLDEVLGLADGDPRPEEVAEAREEAGALWAAVETLPPDQRRAVVLRFSHGLRGKEIAERMGRSEGAVKQLLFRAMVALRERLRGEHG